MNYLLSPAGQKIWAEKGYRPVIEGVAAPGQFPTPPGLFTIDYLGGWKKVGQGILRTRRPGIVTKIEQSLGVSTCEIAARALAGAASPGSPRASVGALTGARRARPLGHAACSARA